MGKTASDRTLAELASRLVPWNNANLVAAHEGVAGALPWCTAIASEAVLSFASTHAPVTQTEA